jgi:hypothetical protein
MHITLTAGCQDAAKPHPHVVLINDVICSEHAFVASFLELVMDAPVMLQTLGSAGVPHASHVA